MKNNLNSIDEGKERLNYLRIDHKNNMHSFDDEALVKLKIGLYTTLAAIEEEIIGREINKLFDKFIPNGNGDLLKSNLILTKQFHEISPINPEEVRLSLDGIINRNYNMEFYFFNNYIEEVVKVLVYSYNEMCSNSNYKINKHEDMLKAIDRIMDQNVDVIKRYRDKEHMNMNNININKTLTLDKFSNSSSSTKSSFSGERVSRARESCVSNITTLSSGSNGAFKYTNSQPNEFEIPTEMIILINKFQTIKKLKLFISTANVRDPIIIKSYIILLLNVEWLFPNLLEVEMDLNCGFLHKELYDKFQIKMNPGVINVHHHTGSGSRKTMVKPGSKRSSGTIVNEYVELISKSTQIFEMIIIYSYFVSKWQKIKIISISFPDCFQNEAEEALRINDIILVNFQFLNFISCITNLIQLNIEFNSLDTGSFERVISLIHKNNYLKSLKLTLFVSEEHYSPAALLKLSSVLKLNVKNGTKGNEDNIDEIILNKLIESFEENMEKLFFVLQSKLTLYEFHLNLDIPRIISSNENYTLTFHKFIFNILAILNNEKTSLNTIKINAPFLSFDNRKYPGIGKFFDKVDLKTKNNKLINMTVMLGFNKVINLKNIISTNLKYLQIGELDYESFSNFLKYYQSNDFIMKTKLTCLKLYLSNLLFDYKMISKEFINLFQGRKPQNLREMYIFSNLIIDDLEINKIFESINYDTVEKYYFEFNKKCHQLILPQEHVNECVSRGNNFPILFYTVNNRYRNFIIIKLLARLKSIQMGIFNSKIFKSVNVYLTPKEKKDIDIKFK
jgi:hypothetical protein